MSKRNVVHIFQNLSRPSAYTKWWYIHTTCPCVLLLRKFPGMNFGDNTIPLHSLGMDLLYRRISQHRHGQGVWDFKISFTAVLRLNTWKSVFLAQTKYWVFIRFSIPKLHRTIKQFLARVVMSTQSMLLGSMRDSKLWATH